MTQSPRGLVEHFFRHESANLVSVLTRVFGFAHLQLVEDTVQSALLEALEHWKINGAPENPAAWVHRVARNKALDALRRKKTETRIFEDLSELSTSTGQAAAAGFDALFAPAGITDSLLRMMFACSHPAIDRQSQLALMLKLLCGFSDKEIASALLISAEGARKRVYRAKKQIAESSIPFEIPDETEIGTRIGAVNEVLYLMFNEGYSSSSGEEAIREDLCEEAARLCHLLCTSDRFDNKNPELAASSRALLALMLYHAARFGSRTDETGNPVLLQDQQRSLWDRKMIVHADYWLMKSEGETLTTYHLEAGIAQVHCRAGSFEQTDWQKIVSLYDRLIEINPTPIYALNRAVAVAHSGDPVSAISALEQIAGDPRLKNYFLLDCAFAESYLQKDEKEKARAHWEKALKAASSEHEKNFIAGRLKQLG